LKTAALGCGFFTPPNIATTQEITMPKGQRSSKEVKKPKKDQPSKPVSPGAVMPTRTTVVPERSKKK
jgi:hypothetical protein